MEQGQVRPLSAVRNGETVTITRIEAGRGLSSRLISMGLVPNTKITVLNNEQPGPFVIKVRDSKIVLGRGMADKILVE